MDSLNDIIWWWGAISGGVFTVVGFLFLLTFLVVQLIEFIISTWGFKRQFLEFMWEKLKKENREG